MSFKVAWLQRPSVRRVAKVGSVCTVVAGLVGTVGNLERVPEYLCLLPGLHAVCGWAGVGKVASAEEENAWHLAEDATEPTSLKAYVSKYPRGIHVDAALMRLAACRSTPREVWISEQRSLPLYIAAGGVSEPSLAAAREAAQRRGARDANVTCAGFNGEFRVKRSHAEVRDWNCRTRDDGSSCAFDGLAICDVESRRVLSEMSCP
jgi:hypothetical protein